MSKIQKNAVDFLKEKKASILIFAFGVITLLIPTINSSFLDWTSFFIYVSFLASLVIVSDLIIKDDTEKSEQATNTLRNLVEMSVIIISVFFAYNSSWFDKIFNFRSVNIAGEIKLFKDSKRVPFNEKILFKYKLYGEKQDEGKNNQNTDRKIPIVIESEHGVINKKIDVHKRYKYAAIEIIDTNFQFLGDKFISNSDIPVADTLMYIDSIPIYQNTIYFNPTLIDVSEKNSLSAYAD